MGLREKKYLLVLSIVSPVYCCWDHFSLRHIHLGDAVKPQLTGAFYSPVLMRHPKVKVHSLDLKTRKLGVGRGWQGTSQVPWVVLSFSTAVTDTQWALSTKEAVVRPIAKENYLVKLLWKVCLEKSPVKSCSSSMVAVSCPSRCGPRFGGCRWAGVFHLLVISRVSFTLTKNFFIHSHSFHRILPSSFFTLCQQPGIMTLIASVQLSWIRSLTVAVLILSP